MKTVERKGRRPDRKGVLANFQFYVDEDSKGLCEGITLNVSAGGFGFLTEVQISQGQTITVIKHSLPGFPCSKAKVRWVRRGPHCIEAGAEFQSGN